MQFVSPEDQERFEQAMDRLRERLGIPHPPHRRKQDGRRPYQNDARPRAVDP